MAMVAERAGVSGQTVSRVANASPRVDPATRARVEQVMADLGYRPNRAARALRTGRSQTLGVVAQTLATVGNSRMLQAVAAAASERGYALTVVTLGQDGDIATAFEHLHDQGVDGAVVLNEATALAREANAAGLRLVVVDAPADDRFTVIGTDHAAGARAATEHLLSLGHRDVAHLAGPEGSFAAAERERGWWEVLKGTRRIPPLGTQETHRERQNPSRTVVRGDWTAESGYAAAREFADASAVFAANDQMALGLIRGLTDLGRRVPEDVSVIGFDDVPEAANYRPPLTTVRQDFDALGAQAVAALVAGIEGKTALTTGLSAPRLVVRDSTSAVFDR